MARVLFFGATADIVGSREMERKAQGSDQLLKDLIENYPRLGSHKLLVAVNQEYVFGDRPLDEADEIAIFTAVSGG